MAGSHAALIARELSLRQSLDEHLMPDDVYLIHLQHPPCGLPAVRPDNFSALRTAAGLDQFSSGRWITFRPAGSIPAPGKPPTSNHSNTRRRAHDDVARRLQ